MHQNTGERVLTLVATIVQVDKVLLVLLGQSGGIDSITVILTRDMALSSGQIQSWDIVSPVAVLKLNGAGTCCKSQQLVSEADTKDRNLGGLH